MDLLLQVSRVSVEYIAPRGEVVRALHNVNLELRSRETLGILGESGSGKSTLALALLHLLPPNSSVFSGQVRYRDHDLLVLDQRRLREIRGAEISVIFQEPAMALNPVLTAGRQIAEVLRAHSPMKKAEVERETQTILARMGFENPERIAASYPHQLSGGQRQRVAIAQALACRPSILIADEPLSSLDTVTQAEILELLQRLKLELDLSILFITH